MKQWRHGDKRTGLAAPIVFAVAGLIPGCIPWHGGDSGGHMSGGYRAEQPGKTALELLDEAYARGEIGREEYLRKREDLMRR